MKTLKIAGLLITLTILIQSCATLQPNELGLKQTLGKLSNTTLGPGVHGFNPFLSTIITYDTRIQMLKEKDQFTTRDGLEVSADIVLLYVLKTDQIKKIHLQLGPNYETKFVVPNFGSTIRETIIQFDAKDVISKKEELEKDIIQKLADAMEDNGFHIKDVLIRDLDLPEDVYKSIKNKVNAEQNSKLKIVEIENQRRELDFDIEKQKKQYDQDIEKEMKKADLEIAKQKKDAERMQIEAEAIKKYQNTVNESITDKQLRLKSIELSRGLLTSPNTKVIITDGKSPIILNDGSDPNVASHYLK